MNVEVSVSSDDDYRAKRRHYKIFKMVLVQMDIVGRDKLVQRKDKLDKDYQDYKNKDKQIAVSTLRYSVKFAMQKGGNDCKCFL